MRAEQLFVERFVCVVAADHPLADAGGITLRDYRDARHVVVDVHDGWQPDVDLPLEKLGVIRNAGCARGTGCSGRDRDDAVPHGLASGLR
ncbi:LysR substrate-binding domain-containing protein [Mycolicibacterium sp. 120320]